MKRFVNADTVKGTIANSETLNNYAYANGNPVSFVDPFGKYAVADDVVFTVGGLLYGLGSTLVGDAISNVITGGKTGFSSWQTYVSHAVGGAVTGEVTLYGGPIIGCAVGNATSDLTKQIIDVSSGERKDYDLLELAKSAGIGAVLGKLGGLEYGGEPLTYEGEADSLANAIESTSSYYYSLYASSSTGLHSYK